MKKLSTSMIFVPLGTHRDLVLEAILSDDHFVTSRNLGGFKYPTRLKAIENLDVIDSCYKEATDSPNIERVLGARKLHSEVCVHSGPMDFVTAVKRAGKIEWKINIEQQRTLTR